MLLTKQLDAARQALFETINGWLILLNILIHQAHIQVDRCNVRVVLTADKLEDGESSSHVLESSVPGTDCVVVESECRVRVGIHWRIEA